MFFSHSKRHSGMSIAPLNRLYADFQPVLKTIRIGKPLGRPLSLKLTPISLKNDHSEGHMRTLMSVRMLKSER